MSKSGTIWKDSLDPLLETALDIIKWRISNGFSWNHELREEFWSKLCQLFPTDFLPKGTVSASVDSAVDYLSRVSAVKVVARAECTRCHEDMGWFKYQLENALEISTTNLKSVPDNLTDLVLAMIERQMRKLLGPGGKRVKCSFCEYLGATVSEISLSNLAIPSVLILRFLVKAHGSQTVKCKLEEKVQFGPSEFGLTAAVLCKPMHFVAVSKLKDGFYNLDNLDNCQGKKSFSTFKGAVVGREVGEKDVIELDNKSSETRRAGAIQYALYSGSSYLGEEFMKWNGTSKDINKMVMPMGDRDEAPDMNNNGAAAAEKTVRVPSNHEFDEVNLDSEDDNTGEISDVEISPGKEFGDILIEVNERMKEGEAGEDQMNQDQVKKDKAVVEIDNSSKWEPSKKLPTSKEEVVVDDKKSSSENKAGEATDDEDMGVSTDSEEENVGEGEDFVLEEVNKLYDNPDLRLRTFQDMGRLCKLFPGSYFDHDKGAWMCRKCQAFACPSSARNPWISTGVKLKDHPIRKMEKHFNSNIHKNSLETEQILNKPSVYKILQKYSLEKDIKKEVANRKVLKVMFTVGIYMVKHRCPNDSFPDLMNLAANSGADDIKKYLSECPKNANYLSPQSFKELLKVMNDYVEKPILEAAKGELFTIFIDETTAVGNISVCNVFIMFDDGKSVKEHYLGTVNMNHGLGLSAKHFYRAAADLLAKKGLDIKDCAFSEMDGCSTNQGRRKGLKLYFIFHNPHHISESCGSHKVALLPQKLIVDGEYQSLQSADGVAVGLSAYFKDSSLRTAILENTQRVLGNKVLKLISPASTRWLTHLQCSKRLIEVLPSVLPALSSIYSDKDDMKALGFMLAIIKPEFLLSCLALHDVFQVMSLLIHWLQTSPSKADITKVPVLVKTTVYKLCYLAGDGAKKIQQFL